MSNIEELNNIPDISFIENKKLEDVQKEMIEDYIAEYESITGKVITLADGSPERIMLNAFSSQIYQTMKYVDNAGKMGLLKYSKGDYLDNVSALKGIIRNPATSAKCTIKYSLSQAQSSVVAIPGGSRVAAGDIFFTTDEYMEIGIGELSNEVTATCILKGTIGNGIALGKVDTMVDIIAYVGKVENITVSSGGADVENDDKLTLRALTSTSSQSVAGPSSAYIYHTKQARGDIEDVKAYSPSATRVNIIFTLTGGVIPDETAIKEVEEYVNGDIRRPLTDMVTVMAPETESYNIDITYYINKSDASQAVTIQNAVNEAVNQYIKWQHKIGIDIAPSKLIQLIMEAGSKRVEVREPTRVITDEFKLPTVGSVNIIYGGVEDD